MSLAARIENFFSRRYENRPALYLPSGRLGLWLALRCWLSPGARVLLSPVTCDQVIFAVLAAGMKPVLAPIDEATGNMDANAVKPAEWDALDAVVTTNLYGVPDDMRRLVEACKNHRVVLIEDACHALESRVDGGLIGSFGECALFSMAKHLPGAGGVLLFRDERDRSRLCALLDEALDNALTARARSLFRRLKNKIAPSRKAGAENVGHRIAFDRVTLDHAISQAPDIRAFDVFLGEKKSSYRQTTNRAGQLCTVAALDAWESSRQHRIEGVKWFRDHGCITPDVRIPEDAVLLRVPLFVDHREETIARLAALGLRITLVYDPPLHEYMPWIEKIGGAFSPGQRRWCESVLPVNPLDFRRFADLCDAIQPHATTF